MKKLLLLALSFSFYCSFTNAQHWNETIRALASDGASGDEFGSSVSISGDYAVVGAFKEDEDAAGENTVPWAGSVYIYQRQNDGNWQELQKIVASDRSPGMDFFGNAVFIDGDYIFVGAPGNSLDSLGNNSISSAGAAYIFKKEANGFWQEIQKIVASERSLDAQFGMSISYSDSVLVVGSPLNNTGGAAYVFEEGNDGHWQEVQKLIATDHANSGLFAYSLSLQGRHLIIGDLWQDSRKGAAYIFEKSNTGSWEEVKKFTGLLTEEIFGQSVDLDGDYAIVGAFNADYTDYSQMGRGAAHIYERASDGEWKEVQKIPAPGGLIGDSFGYGVAISGQLAIIGAIGESTDASGNNPINNAGAVYVFKRENNGNWKNTQRMVASKRAANNRFGTFISSDGQSIIIGTPEEDVQPSGSNVLVDQGAVYIFGATGSVGIKENNFERSLNIYPNPTSGILHVELGDSYSASILSVKNILGQTLFAKSSNNAQVIQLELEGAPGIYLIEVQTSDGQRSIRKVYKE